VPDAYVPRPPVFLTVAPNAHAGMSDSVREQIARTLREFGLEPKGQVRMYQKWYPEFFIPCHILGDSGCQILLNSQGKTLKPRMRM
jgi:hypothetical protein